MSSSSGRTPPLRNLGSDACAQGHAGVRLRHAYPAGRHSSRWTRRLDRRLRHHHSRLPRLVAGVVPMQKLEPMWWALFSVGGTVAAFALPALIFANNVAGPLGWLPDAVAYDNILSLLGNPSPSCSSSSCSPRPSSTPPIASPPSPPTSSYPYPRPSPPPSATSAH